MQCRQAWQARTPTMCSQRQASWPLPMRTACRPQCWTECPLCTAPRSLPTTLPTFCSINGDENGKSLFHEQAPKIHSYSLYYLSIAVVNGFVQSCKWKVKQKFRFGDWDLHEGEHHLWQVCSWQLALSCQVFVKNKLQHSHNAVEETKHREYLLIPKQRWANCKPDIRNFQLIWHTNI